MIALAAFTEGDTAGMTPAAHMAEQRDSEQTVLSLGGSALPKHAERDMLDLDDEMAALIAAAAVPADQAGTHSSQPESVSPVAGELAGVLSMVAAALLVMTCAVLCCDSGSAMHCCNMATAYTFAVMYLLTCLCSADNPKSITSYFTICNGTS